MKFLIVLATLILSMRSFSEEVSCRSQKAIQEKESNAMNVDADLKFTVSRDTKEITNLSGHIFVQHVFIEDQEIAVNNSYLGFFKFDKLSSNPNYNPSRYKNYTQYKKFDAIHTAGLESGMWGAFVVDLTKTTPTFDARYIFKAGDHMGGTVLFTCKSL